MHHMILLFIIYTFLVAIARASSIESSTSSDELKREFQDVINQASLLEQQYLLNASIYMDECIQNFTFCQQKWISKDRRYLSIFQSLKTTFPASNLSPSQLLVVQSISPFFHSSFSIHRHLSTPTSSSSSSSTSWKEAVQLVVSFLVGFQTTGSILTTLTNAKKEKFWFIPSFLMSLFQKSCLPKIFKTTSFWLGELHYISTPLIIFIFIIHLLENGGYQILYHFGRKLWNTSFLLNLRRINNFPFQRQPKPRLSLKSYQIIKSIQKQYNSSTTQLHVYPIKESSSSNSWVIKYETKPINKI